MLNELSTTEMSEDLQKSSDKIFINGPPTRLVKLNVGGCFFHTSLGTLCKYDCMLRAMFSGGIPVSYLYFFLVL